MARAGKMNKGPNYGPDIEDEIIHIYYARANYMARWGGTTTAVLAAKRERWKGEDMAAAYRTLPPYPSDEFNKFADTFRHAVEQLRRWEMR